VTIRLNEWGLRNGPVEPVPAAGAGSCSSAARFALWLGACPKKPVEARLRDAAPRRRERTGAERRRRNYNAERYVSASSKELKDLDHTDIVVHIPATARIFRLRRQNPARISEPP